MVRKYCMNSGGRKQSGLWPEGWEGLERWNPGRGCCSTMGSQELESLEGRWSSTVRKNNLGLRDSLAHNTKCLPKL